MEIVRPPILYPQITAE